MREPCSSPIRVQALATSTACGAGDPLFHYSKRKGRLPRRIRCCWRCRLAPTGEGLRDVDDLKGGSGPAVGARPDHVGAITRFSSLGPTRGRSASERMPAGSFPRSSSDARIRRALANAWSRRSRMTCLGEQRLEVSTVGGDAGQRLPDGELVHLAGALIGEH
jgi:hypothetical protein